MDAWEFHKLVTAYRYRDALLLFDAFIVLRRSFKYSSSVLRNIFLKIISYFHVAVSTIP